MSCIRGTERCIQIVGQRTANIYTLKSLVGRYRALISVVIITMQIDVYKWPVCSYNKNTNIHLEHRLHVIVYVNEFLNWQDTKFVTLLFLLILISLHCHVF